MRRQVRACHGHSAGLREVMCDQEREKERRRLVEKDEVDSLRPRKIYSLCMLHALFSNVG